jgi:diguanylate cyclase (GGDEF)-like protein
LLTEVAARLRKCVREGDTVARLGGDEFVILLPQLSADPQIADTDAMAIAEKIRYAVEQPYSLEGTPYDCTSSLGVDVSRQSALDVAEALKRADAAMYRAKGCGRNSIALTHDNAA